MPSSADANGLRFGLAAATLLLEATAREVRRALADRAIDVVILRGPALTEWLYGNGELRPSSDVDALVPYNSFEAATEALRSLGFRPFVQLQPMTETDHAVNWTRGYGPAVDLHWSVVGVGAHPQALWDELVSRRQSYRGQPVPGASHRPFLVGLHAGQHGPTNAGTVGDLRAALRRTTPEEWSDAAQLAERLGAVELFAYGLRLLPEGAVIANWLGLPSEVSARTAVRGSVPTATGFAWLEETAGLSTRLRLLRHRIFPPVAYMRDWLPLARRGRVGLSLAYLYRPLWLTRWAPAGYAAWRQAKKMAAASRDH